MHMALIFSTCATTFFPSFAKIITYSYPKTQAKKFLIFIQDSKPKKNFLKIILKLQKNRENQNENVCKK